MREHIRTFFAAVGAVCAVALLMAANNGPVAIPTTVSNGGTGVTTLASGNIPLGAGTSPFTALAGTNANDQVAWNGSAWAATRTLGSGFVPLRGTSPLQTYYGPAGETVSGTVAISVLRAIPFVAPYTGTIDLIAAECTGTNANAVARIGIYSTGADGYPSSLVVDSGEITVAAAAMRTASISAALTAGNLYWTAYLGGTANSTMRNYNTGTTDFGGGTLAAWPTTALSGNVVGITVSQAYGALPNPFTAGAALSTSAAIPIVVFRYQ